jgi:hypothetical protein
MDTITDHGMKVRAASRHFGIPQISLRNHLYGRVISRERGSQSVLKREENTKLAIFALGQVHCSTPISVQKLGFVKILPP